MTEASKPNVTPRDRAAKENPRSVVAHVAGFSALRASTDARHSRLSGSAQRLLTWVAMRSREFGCAWTRMEELAQHLGISRRVLRLRRRELEDAGFIRTELVRRGKALPTGRIALFETAILYPTHPSARIAGIPDPARIIPDPQDPSCGPPDTFSVKKIQVEVVDRARARLPEAEPAPEPMLRVARTVLLRWQAKLAPHIDLDALEIDAQLAWTHLVVARLKEGFTEAQCIRAVDAHERSPHNKDWSRRNVFAVFGCPKRLEKMASLGSTAPPNAPVRQIRKLAPLPEIPMDPTYEAEVRARIEKRKQEEAHERNQPPAG
jgi:hypothetical protein